MIAANIKYEMNGGVGFERKDREHVPKNGARPLMRLFVCVSPDEGAVDEIASFAVSLKKFTGFRWVGRESLHITLKFLGEISPGRVTELDTNLSRIGGIRPFSIKLSRVGAFPNMASPKSLWIGVGEGSETLAKLARSVGAAAVASGCEAEKRGFHPHLTLARAKGPARGMPESLARALGDAPSPSWVCCGFTLMKSDLLPEGAVYAPVARFPL
jgi:2'-5' RNA ligase